MPARLTPIIHTSKKQTSRLSPVVVALFLSGCSGIQSTLDPHGPHAQSIANISWIMFFGASAILLLVMALALYAIYRDPDKRRAPSAGSLIVMGGLALPVLSLSALLVYGVHAMGELRAESGDEPIQIDVTGNRWWWDVYYRDVDGNVIAGANEIRIPAGVPVKVAVRTNDVIHSFWVPNLAGKIDLIPGRTNHLVLQADAPGIFRGQCAEFCGAQHARMAFHVIAETPDAHAAWMNRQGAQAPAPSDPGLLRGRDAFVANDCLQCHTVRGLGAARELGRGPDLTHVGSRRFIAAGTLENTPTNLAAFIARSQDIKPGNGMPSYRHLDEQTLHDIANYLESLR
jgi:cytochrome c oxidase subunit 2